MDTEMPSGAAIEGLISPSESASGEHVFINNICD